RRRLLRLRVRGPAGEGGPLLRGDGLEFAELRAYEQGDDPRRIDWAATARSGQLQTRVMLEESGLHLVCAVDHGPRMLLGRARALRAAGDAFAELWLGAARDRDVVRLMLGNRVLDSGGLRGERAAAFVLAHLRADDEPGRALDGAALMELDAAAPPGSAVLVVGECYALEESLHEPALARLPQRRYALARVARDPWAGGLPLRGAVRLRDAPGGAVRTLRIDGRAAERHAAACAARERRVLERMTALGWRVRLFDESTPAADLLE
ncbi:MAG: DUF58 domain-containing protein, partial [bacterium]|nr:DUF58 domain-containing protein [bacterium]